MNVQERTAVLKEHGVPNRYGEVAILDENFDEFEVDIDLAALDLSEYDDNVDLQNLTFIQPNLDVYSLNV